MLDDGAIDYFMRMIVTHGFSTAAYDYFREALQIAYENGSKDALVEAAAAATAVVEDDSAKVATKGKK